MTTSFNGYQNLANRTVNLTNLASRTAVDGTLVLAKDGKTIYQFVKSGSSYTVDSDKVYATLDGGDSRWVGIAGEKNYFTIWKPVASGIHYSNGNVGIKIDDPDCTLTIGVSSAANEDIILVKNTTSFPGSATDNLFFLKKEANSTTLRMYDSSGTSMIYLKTEAPSLFLNGLYSGNWAYTADLISYGQFTGFDNTAQATGTGYSLRLYGLYSSSPTSHMEGGGISLYKINSTSLNCSFGLAFKTRKNGESVATKMFLDDNGILALGTTTPSSNIKLHIYDTSTPYIYLDRGSSNTAYIGVTSSNTFIQVNNNLNFSLIVNSSTAIYVGGDDNKRIGLKTSSPTTDVDINGVLRIRGGSPVAGYYLTCDANGVCSWAAGGGSGGSSTFIGLSDTPASFSGQAGKGLRVNAGETALEWVTLSGTGTVTSVSLTGITGIINITGSPITTTGTLGLTLATQSANVVFAGPVSGSAAAPAFRSLVANDIPNLSTSKITSGVFSVERGGTGLATIATNSYLKGNGTSALVPRTYSEVRTDLGLVIGTNIQAYSQRLDQLAAISPLQGDLIYADSSAIWKRLPKNTNATRYLSNTGKDNQPFWALVNLENGVLGVLHPTKGGTGLSEYRYGDMLYGVAPNNLSVLEVGNENEVIASTGTFPAYKKLHQIQDAFASFTSDQNASWDTSVGLNKKWSIDGDYSLTISNLQNGMFGALKIEVTDVATVTLIVSGITTEGHGSLEELDINTYMFCFAYDGDTLKWNIADYE